MASQFESVGKTPPLIIHDILGNEVGGMPHRHVFAILRITAVSSYQSTSTLDGFVSSCDGIGIHHFHREQNKFSEVFTSDTEEPVTRVETPQPLHICCCRCNYKISIGFSQPPISQKNLSLLYQINPDSNKYLKSLYLLSSILSKNLEDSPKSLKLNGASFKAVFPDLEKAKDFFENLGYETADDFLVPIPLIWANKKLIFLAWAQILLEIFNQRLAFVCSYRSICGLAFEIKFWGLKVYALDDIEQSQTVYEDGERKMLEIFGSKYSKCQKQKEISPFEIPPSELSSAYFGLGCISDMPDTLLWSTFELLQEEIPNFRPLLFDFIIEIASDRQSELLQEKIGLARSNGEFSQSELKEAFLHFGFEESEINSINELAILKSYQGLVETKPDELGEHLTKLKLLAFAYGAKSIEKFIETGELPSDSQVRKPIGLDNIGNTCYLNSLLQYYFSVKFLRDQVLSFSSGSQLSEQETALNDQSIEIDNRKISAKELSLAKFFVKHLKVLFHKLETENLQPYIAPSRELAKMALGNMDVSISNNTPPNLPSRHSSINSMETNQAQGSSPGGSMTNLASADPNFLSELNDILPEAPVSPIHSSTSGHRSPSLSIDLSHEHLQDDLPDNPVETSVKEDDLDDLTASPSKDKDTTLENHPELPIVNEREYDLTVSSSPSNDLTFGSQQDVSECMDHIMWQLEKAFATRINSDELKKDKNIIKDLFYGKTCQTLKYKDSKASKDVSSTKEEEFSHLIINVLKPSDIYDGLDEYFQKSIVELDGTQAVRELSISKAPPFLQIQLQRVQFDRQTLQVYKSNEFLKLYDRIYIDRYLSDSQNDPKMTERFADIDREKTRLKSAIERHLFLASSDDRLQFKENEATVENSSGQLAKCSEEQVEHQGDKILDLGATSSTIMFNGSALSNDSKKDVKTTRASGDKVENMENFDTVTSSERLSELQSELECLHSKYLQAEYSLHAVLIHKGTANYGHYWVYIKDWVKNTWFRYNDEYVSSVLESEIFTDTTGLVANPYYVIYIETSRISDLLECPKEIQK